MIKSLIKFAFTLFSLSLTSTVLYAANIQFLIFDNDTQDFLNFGHLEENSVLLDELKEAGLFLGKRIDSNETIKIGINIDYAFGGSAKADWTDAVFINSTFNGASASLRTIPALENILSPGPDTSCKPHFDIWYDLEIFFKSERNELKNFYPPGTIRGTTFHEMAHGMGVISNRSNDEIFLETNPDGLTSFNAQVTLTEFDLLIDRLEEEDNEFAVGGETVKALYGKQVRLLESFQRQSFSHIGQTSPINIRSDGVTSCCNSSIFGELGNIDVGTSATSAGASYIRPQTITPVDIAIFRDLGYPTAPLNASFYSNTNSRDEDFPNEFTNTIEIPFLQLNRKTYSIQLMWIEDTKYSLLGVADTGKIGAVKLTKNAASALDSEFATFSKGILSIPNLEIYSDGKVQHYSAKFAMISPTVPITFDLLTLDPIESNTPESSVEFIICN